MDARYIASCSAITVQEMVGQETSELRQMDSSKQPNIWVICSLAGYLVCLDSGALKPRNCLESETQRAISYFGLFPGPNPRSWGRGHNPKCRGLHFLFRWFPAPKPRAQGSSQN